MDEKHMAERLAKARQRARITKAAQILARVMDELAQLDGVAVSFTLCSYDTGGMISIGSTGVNIHKLMHFANEHGTNPAIASFLNPFIFQNHEAGRQLLHELTDLALEMSQEPPEGDDWVKVMREGNDDDGE